MKKMLSFLFVLSLLWEIFPLLSQQVKTNPEEEIKVKTEEKDILSYSPQGRRDPFRNLLAGREIKEKGTALGMPQMSIDDINLVGIVKTKSKYTAIINGPQGFPFFIKNGDEFSDGFVYSIEDTHVVFRKTIERGIPLMKPKDIVKEISPEER